MQFLCLVRYEEAVSIYQTAVEINPGFGPAHYNLAGLYLAAGNPERARRHCRAASQCEYEEAATRARQALARMEARTER